VGPVRRPREVDRRIRLDGGDLRGHRDHHRAVRLHRGASYQRTGARAHAGRLLTAATWTREGRLLLPRAGPRAVRSRGGTCGRQSDSSRTGGPDTFLTSTLVISSARAWVAPDTCITRPGRPFQVATRSVRPSVVWTTRA